MSAFIIIQNSVVDAAKMQAYIPDAVETLTAHGAEILVVAESSTKLEGTPPWPRTIVLKFASREAALAWYNSAEYQKVLPRRTSATPGFAILVDGVDASAQ